MLDHIQEKKLHELYKLQPEERNDISCEESMIAASEAPTPKLLKLLTNKRWYDRYGRSCTIFYPNGSGKVYAWTYRYKYEYPIKWQRSKGDLTITYQEALIKYFEIDGKAFSERKKEELREELGIIYTNHTITYDIKKMDDDYLLLNDPRFDIPYYDYYVSEEVVKKIDEAKAVE